MESPDETIISYATQAGRTADDVDRAVRRVIHAITKDVADDARVGRRRGGHTRGGCDGSDDDLGHCSFSMPRVGYSGHLTGGGFVGAAFSTTGSCRDAGCEARFGHVTGPNILDSGCAIGAGWRAYPVPSVRRLG